MCVDPMVAFARTLAAAVAALAVGSSDDAALLCGGGRRRRGCSCARGRFCKGRSCRGRRGCAWTPWWPLAARSPAAALELGRARWRELRSCAVAGGEGEAARVLEADFVREGLAEDEEDVRGPHGGVCTHARSSGRGTRCWLVRRRCAPVRWREAKARLLVCSRPIL